MQAPDPVEAIMARLMPVAISQDGQIELEAMIDDLAPEADKVVEISSKNWAIRLIAGGGIAAALGGLCAIYPFQESPVATGSAQEVSGPEQVLVSTSDRVESMIDEGLREDSYGAALHAVRLNIVAENEILDVKSKMLIKVVEPREEKLLIPVSSLSLSKPGKEGVLAGARGGKPLKVKLKPGLAPLPVTSDIVEATIRPEESSGTMRVVNVSEKSASFTADEGTATVQREGDVFKIRIDGPDNRLIFEGDLTKDGGLDKIPDSWRRKIQVLCRTLDQAIDGNIGSGRQPRPRVIPPPANR